MPFCSKFGVHDSEAIGWSDPSVRTEWASPAAGSFGHRCLPFVVFSLGTLPPYFFVAPGRDIRWRQAVVLGRVPFFGNPWISGCQACFRTGKPVATIRAAIVFPMAEQELCLPLMSLLTTPPDFDMASGNNILWGKVSILGRMPLVRKVRTNCCQAIGFANTSAGTTGTTHSFHSPVGNDCWPFMVVSLGALPPHLSIAPCHYIPAGKSVVLCGMPLSCKFWMRGRQAVFTARLLIPTIGTLVTAPGSTIDCGFPFMPVLTSPPDLLAAASYNVIRGESVLGWMPLGSEGWMSHC